MDRHHKSQTSRDSTAIWKKRLIPCNSTVQGKKKIYQVSTYVWNPMIFLDDDASADQSPDRELLRATAHN